MVGYVRLRGLAVGRGPLVEKLALGVRMTRAKETQRSTSYVPDGQQGSVALYPDVLAEVDITYVILLPQVSPPYVRALSKDSHGTLGKSLCRRPSLGLTR